KSFTLSGPGESFALDEFTFKYEDLAFTANDNRQMTTAKVAVAKGGTPVGTLYPARWHYTTGSQETTTEVDIQDDRMVKDVYVVLNGFDGESKQANFTVYINPLVHFVWIGWGMMAIGTAVCLFPAALLRFRRGSAAAILLLGLALGAGTARADNQTKPMEGTSAHVIVKGAVEDDANAPPVAKRLWKDLVCLCGGCQRGALSEGRWRPR